MYSKSLALTEMPPSTCIADCSYGPMNPSKDLQLNSQFLGPNDDGIPLVPPASKDNIEGLSKNVAYKII